MDVDDRQKIINLERDLLLAKDHAATLQRQNAILTDALNEDFALSQIQSNALVSMKRQNAILRETLNAITALTKSNEGSHTRAAEIHSICEEALQRTGGGE